MIACHRQIGLTFIAVVSVLAACVQQDQSTIDEDAIDDVWHKAKLRGVAFRAVGQEPGWLLEITNGEEIVLATDYGENRQSLPYVDPIVHQDERRTEFILDSYNTTIEIRGEHCTDSMSGESFEVTVTIFLQGRELHGCGRALF